MEFLIIFDTVIRGLHSCSTDAKCIPANYFQFYVMCTNLRSFYDFTKNRVVCKKDLKVLKNGMLPDDKRSAHKKEIVIVAVLPLCGCTCRHYHIHIQEGFLLRASLFREVSEAGEIDINIVAKNVTVT